MSRKAEAPEVQYQFRKVQDPSETELATLISHGWEYVDEMKGKDAEGERTVSTGIHRFRRPTVVTTGDDVKLSPKDVYAKIKALSR